MKHKLSWHFYAVLSVVLLIAAAVAAYMLKQVEFSYEMADLQTMNAARASAELKWREKLPEEPVEYWYDGSSYSLVPTSGKKPKPCGSGTRRIGGAVKEFQKENDLQVDTYNESESYLGKLPRVTVRKAGDELSISIDWVD